MKKAKVFMDDFMNKLRADDYEKDNQPNKGPEINAEFIAEQLSAYADVINSGIIEKVTGKKLVRKCFRQ